MSSQYKNHLLFYDGDCGFCNKSVQFVLKHNTKNPLLFFAPLQTQFCTDLLEEMHHPPLHLNTIILYIEGTIYTQSDAVIQILKHCKQYQFIGILFSIIPKKLRDKCYQIVSKNRKRWNSGYCIHPSEKELDRFIDFNN